MAVPARGKSKKRHFKSSQSYEMTPQRVKMFKEEVEKYKILQHRVRQSRFDLVVLAFTGTSANPLTFGAHLAPATQVAVSMLFAMNRKNAPFFLDAPLLRKGVKLWTHRHQFQRTKCVFRDGDPCFGGPGSLVGYPKDASKFPCLENDWLYGKDTLNFLNEIVLVKEMMKRWESYGSGLFSTRNTRGCMPRRMVELPDGGCLDSWKPNEFFSSDLEVAKLFRDSGADREDKDASMALFRQMYTISPGERGYRGRKIGDVHDGSGLLVDWNMISEELRQTATGSEWIDFSNMPDPPNELIGNGYVTVVEYSGFTESEDKDRWEKDQPLRLANGIRYDYQPLFPVPRGKTKVQRTGPVRHVRAHA
jgi:hypothetical protein